MKANVMVVWLAEYIPLIENKPKYKKEGKTKKTFTLVGDCNYNLKFNTSDREDFNCR